MQESAAGDSLDEALADARLQRDCQQRLAALVAVLRADHMQVPLNPCRLASCSSMHAVRLLSSVQGAKPWRWEVLGFI